MGLVYISEADHEKARSCWEQSVALYRELRLQKRAAVCVHNLGILHRDLGDYALAQAYLEESLMIHRDIGAKARQALDLGWLGNLYLGRGAYDEARRYLDAALALDEAMEGNVEQVWHLVWRGAVSFEMGDLAQAETYLRSALQLAGEQAKGADLSEAYRWLAEVYLAKGKGEAALTAAQQALEKARAGHSLPIVGVCLALLGSVYGSGLLKTPEAPLPYFERAVALLKPDSPDLAFALLRYGEYLARTGEKNAAKERLRQAQRIFERIGARGGLEKLKPFLSE